MCIYIVLFHVFFLVMFYVAMWYLGLCGVSDAANITLHVTFALCVWGCACARARARVCVCVCGVKGFCVHECHLFYISILCALEHHCGLCALKNKLCYTLPDRFCKGSGCVAGIILAVIVHPCILTQATRARYDILSECIMLQDFLYNLGWGSALYLQIIHTL